MIFYVKSYRTKEFQRSTTLKMNISTVVPCILILSSLSFIQLNAPLVTELKLIGEARAGQRQKHVVSPRFVGRTNNESPKLQSGSKFRFAAPTVCLPLSQDSHNRHVADGPECCTNKEQGLPYPSVTSQTSTTSECPA